MVRRAGGVHWAPIGEKMTCAAFDSREGVAGAPSNRRSERRWDGNRAVILTPGWSLRSTPIANVRVLRARARSADAQTPRATQIAHADRPRFSRLLQVAAQGPLLVLAHVGQLAATSARVVLRGRVALYAGGLPQRSQSDRCSHPVMWLVCAHGAETATEGRQCAVVQRLLRPPRGPALCVGFASNAGSRVLLRKTFLRQKAVPVG